MKATRTIEGRNFDEEQYEIMIEIVIGNHDVDEEYEEEEYNRETGAIVGQTFSTKPNPRASQQNFGFVPNNSFYSQKERAEFKRQKAENMIGFHHEIVCLKIK
tara:strand:+ start:545 stop:853 length:309 start_codon:yes stop_codon:yes gene_type:complete